MENLIKKVYEEKMQDGTFEKIVSEQFSQLVKNVCNNVFGYGGAIRKDLENKLNEVMSGLIDNTNFSTYVTKIQYIINEALENTAASDYKKTAESLKAILGQKQIKSFSTIKASELFKEYCNFIKELNIDKSDLADHIDIDYDDGEQTALIECEMQLDDYHNILIFECKDFDDYYKNKYRFEIHLTRDKEVSFKPKIAINDYRYLDNFTCYLLMLSNNWVKVELDEVDAYEEIEIIVND